MTKTLRATPFVTILLGTLGIALLGMSTSMYTIYISTRTPKSIVTTTPPPTDNFYDTYKRHIQKIQKDRTTFEGQLQTTNKIINTAALITGNIMVVCGFWLWLCIAAIQIKLAKTQASIKIPRKLPGFSREIPIEFSSINRILIKRIAPLYRAKLSEKKITWRDVVILDDVIVLKGSVYSHLEILIEAIKKINPNIEINLHVNTVAENLAENL